MRNENLLTKPRSRAIRFLSALLILSASVVALLFVAHFIWLFTGSNRWEFAGERNGVKTYTLKSPGSDLIQLKGVFQVHSTLAGIVTFMRDSGACNDIPGCYGSHVVERVDDQLQYDYYIMKFPFPFHPRDFVNRTQIHQSPQTKEVLVEYAATPGELPLNSCCVRVTNMDNTWRLTPLDNGQVEIEFTMKMNDGGFVPDLLINMHPDFLFGLAHLQPLFDKDKYQNAKLEFISEK
jgi:hypothetical protein